MSTVVYLRHLPINSESSFVYHELFSYSLEAAEKVKDIYTWQDGSDCAWVVFHAHGDAREFAKQYNERHIGPTGNKMYISLTTEADISEYATNRLTDFFHARNHQIQSRTVEITGLPQSHTIRSLNQLLVPVHDEFNVYVPTGDYYDVEPEEILHVKSAKPGIGLVQLANPRQAISIVWRFAGTYWKNATLNVRCVPDKEMEDLLVWNANDGQKEVKLFVDGLRSRASSMEVWDIFKNFPIRDVSIPPGGKSFCFVFVRKEDAKSILALFGNGVQYQGRVIRVSICGVGNMTAAPAAGPFIPPSHTIDLKVNNVPYGTEDFNIPMVFQGFTVTKVTFKKGFAFVRIAAGEADRAIQELNGKRVGDRNITVKLAERTGLF